MINITIKEAYAYHEAIANYIKHVDEPVKGKAGFALRYNFRILHNYLSEFIKKRDDIIKKYADPIDDEDRKKYEEEGKSIPVVITKKENFDKANEEIKEFEDIELELPLLIISIDEVMNSEGIDSNNADLFIWMTKEYRDSIK